MNPIHNAADIFNRHALNYQERFMDVGLYAGTLDAFCDSLPAAAPLLELACGPGNVTRYLLSRRPDLKILATDIAPNMLELAKANNPAAEHQWLDCRDLSNITEQYQGIMCGFCLPYLSGEESRKLISDCATRLLPGGTLYLSCMEENEHYQSGIKTNSAGEQLYVYYHKGEELCKALSHAGLEIKAMERFTTQNGSEAVNTDLVLIATKAGIVFE